MGCMGVSSYLVGGLQGYINFPYESFHLLETRAQLFLSREQGDANEDQISASGEGNWRGSKSVCPKIEWNLPLGHDKEKEMSLKVTSQKNTDKHREKSSVILN